MNVNSPRYSREEVARRGHEIYDRVVRPALRPEDDGKFVVVDIETEEYEIDSAIGNRILERRPDAQLLLMRVGRPAAYRL